MPCLTPTGIENFKKMLTTEGTKLSDLVKMDAKLRKSKIEEFMGKGMTDYINNKIEQKMTAKTKETLLNWVKKEVEPVRSSSDILKRISNIGDELKSKQSMNVLLEDLVAHKIGVAITKEEAGTIFDLATKAEDARKEITAIASADKPYGKAYNLMKKGISEVDALKESGLSKQDYKKITDERIAKGVEVYKYVNFMHKIKGEALQLKKSDWTKNWYVATGKLYKEIFDSFRAIMSSGDLGFIFRQGIKTLYYDPKTWKQNGLEAIDNAIKGAKNVDFKSLTMAEILTRPNYLSGHYREAGLAINTIEDYFENSFIERIMDAKEGKKANILQEAGQRYIKFSQDTYLTYLYKTRADLFDAHWEKLHQSGAEYKAIGDFFNNITGRGRGIIGGGVSGNKGFGEYFMFAPKYTQSQINTFTKIFSEKNKTLRLEYLKNFATFLAGTTTALYLASLMGAKIELDPRSTKFGRISLPNGYVLDIAGGLPAYIVLASRLKAGTKKPNGAIVDTGDFGNTAQDLISNFMFSKGNPQVSLAMSILNNKLYSGEKLTVQNQIASMMPILGQEVAGKLTDEQLSILEKIALSASAFFGISSYNANSNKQYKSK